MSPSRRLPSLALLTLLALFTPACSGPSYGISLRFVEGLASQVAFADLLFFKSDVKCSSLNKDNSSSSGPFKSSLLSYNPLKFSSPGEKLILDGLPEGSGITAYLLGVNSKKEVIAQGCKEGLTLKTGTILSLDIQVASP